MRKLHCPFCRCIYCFIELFIFFFFVFFTILLLFRFFFVIFDLVFANLLFSLSVFHVDGWVFALCATTLHYSYLTSVLRVKPLLNLGFLLWDFTMAQSQKIGQSLSIC